MSEALTRKTGPTLNQPNSIWPGFGGVQAAEAAVRPGTGILLKGHNLVFGIGHVTIRIVPRNPAKWMSERPAYFVHRAEDGSLVPNLDQYGNPYFTIGAGPDAQHDTLGFGCFVNPHTVQATLTSGISRKDDVEKPSQDLAPIWYTRAYEDNYIYDLIVHTEAYANNLGYVCIPRADNDGYNSNSFALGLLRAAHLGPPPFLYKESFATCSPTNPYGCDAYPGWQKPVPTASFR